VAGRTLKGSFKLPHVARTESGRLDLIDAEFPGTVHGDQLEFLLRPAKSRDLVQLLAPGSRLRL